MEYDRDDTYDAPFAEYSRAEGFFRSIPAPASTSVPAIKLRIKAAASFDGVLIPERPWLVPDLVPDRAVTLVSGDGGVGKSLLLKQLAVAVATGKDWIGTLPQQGRVLYVSAEDDEDEIHRRLADIVASRGMELSELGNLHVLSLASEDAVLAAPDRGGIICATKLWHALLEAVDRIEPCLIVLDTLADLFAGNENARPEARQFIGLLRGAAISRNLAVVLIGHPSLTGISSGTGTSGSTAWSNSVRSRLYLDRAKAEDGDEPDPSLRVLRVMKANYGPVGAEIRLQWKNGAFSLVGGGATGFSRIVAETSAEAKFLEILRLFTQQGRDVSPNKGPTYAPAVFAKHPDAEGYRGRALVGAMERLLSAERIKIATFGPPSKPRSKIVEASEESRDP